MGVPVTFHRIFPPYTMRVRPREGTEDDANNSTGRADHWHPAGRGGSENDLGDCFPDEVMQARKAPISAASTACPRARAALHTHRTNVALPADRRSRLDPRAGTDAASAQITGAVMTLLVRLPAPRRAERLAGARAVIGDVAHHSDHLIRLASNGLVTHGETAVERKDARVLLVVINARRPIQHARRDDKREVGQSTAMAHPRPICSVRWYKRCASSCPARPSFTTASTRLLNPVPAVPSARRS